MDLQKTNLAVSKKKRELHQHKKKVVTHTQDIPTEHLISRLVDSLLWKAFAGSVSPSLSEDSSPAPVEDFTVFAPLLPPDAILDYNADILFVVYLCNRGFRKIARDGTGGYMSFSQRLEIKQESTVLGLMLVKLMNYKLF